MKKNKTVQSYAYQRLKIPHRIQDRPRGHDLLQESLFFLLPLFLLFHLFINIFSKIKVAEVLLILSNIF